MVSGIHWRLWIVSVIQKGRPLCYEVWQGFFFSHERRLMSASLKKKKKKEGLQWYSGFWFTVGQKTQIEGRTNLLLEASISNLQNSKYISILVPSGSWRVGVENCRRQCAITGLKRNMQQRNATELGTTWWHLHLTKVHLWLGKVLRVDTLSSGL